MSKDFLLALYKCGLRKRELISSEGIEKVQTVRTSIEDLRKFSAEQGLRLFLYVDVQVKGYITLSPRVYDVRILEQEQLLDFLSKGENLYIFSQALAISNLVTDEKIKEIMQNLVAKANTLPLFRGELNPEGEPRRCIDLPKFCAESYFKSIFDFSHRSNFSYLSTDKTQWTSLELYPDVRTDANYFAFEIADIPCVEDPSNCDVMVKLRVIAQEEMRKDDLREELPAQFLVTFRVVTGNWLKNNIPENDLFFTQRTLMVNKLSQDVVQEHIDASLILFATCTDRADAIGSLSVYFNLPEEVLRLFDENEWDVHI